MVVALQHLSRVCCELDLRWLTVFVFHCVPILTRPPPSPSANPYGVAWYERLSPQGKPALAR